MRLAFLAAVVSGLVVGLVIAGVRLWDRDGQEADAGPGAVALPSEATAEAFASAWVESDTQRIYALLDRASRSIYSPMAVEDAYASYDREVTAERVEVAVESASPDSATLRARVFTAYFGTLEYTIELPLVREDGVYRVGWSPAVVHPDLGQGRSFRSDIERPQRGAILDRNGLPLAETRDVRMVGLNRSVIVERARVVEALVGLGFTRAQVDAAFASGLGASQRVAVGPVSDARAEEAIAVMQSLPGVILYFETQRVHPLGAAAAHVVGYTRELTAEELAARPGKGLRVGDRVGAVGLEAAFEAELAGSGGAELRLVDADGATLRVLVSRPLVKSQDVKTTLDAAVLQRTYERLGARAGAAVVIRPATNEILAMVSTPSFDPDAFERNDAAVLRTILDDRRGPLTNRTISGTYSAGSTFKLVTGAAGLTAGVVTTGERIFCGAVWAGVEPPRRNWEGSQGPLTIAEALMRSCNPVFYEVGLRLYNQTDGALSEMARRFGFGGESGMAVLPEEAGLVPDAAWKQANRGEPWYPGDEVNLAIGQGALLVTPLQLANAYSTFLSGELRNPVLIAGESAAVRASLGLAPAHSALLRSGLELVTGSSGTAAAAFWNAGYTDFGGKSGTAEDAGSQQHVLFVAYSPKVAPGAVAAVVLDDGESGSLEAGPIARDAVLAALGRP